MIPAIPTFWFCKRPIKPGQGLQDYGGGRKQILYGKPVGRAYKASLQPAVKTTGRRVKHTWNFFYTGLSCTSFGGRRTRTMSLIPLA